MIRKLKRITLAVFLISLFHILTTAQDQNQKQIIDTSRSLNCEYTAAIVDSFIQGLSADSNVIIVGFRGSGESVGVVRKRIETATHYFTDYHKITKFARSRSSVVGAVGIETLNQGRLSFYVDGELQLEILFKYNRKLRLSPCVK